MLALLLLAGPAPAAAGELLELARAQAVRGGWHDAAPPEAGWQAVDLPDNWAVRWPSQDGVVWYRFTWQHAGDAPAALMLAWINMAGSVYVNGIELHRDASLLEPLTRSWNTPRQWLVAPALLREGENTVLVRVAGMAAYQGGLPPLLAGEPAQVQARYEEELLWRHDLPLVAMAASVVIVLLFGGLWLMRPRETAYAWFALMSLAWLLFEFNHLATSPWPLAGTDAWQALNTSLLVFFAAAFLLFVLRLRREEGAPLVEAAIWLAAVLAWADLWSLPRTGMAAHRALWSSVAAAATAAAAVGVFAVRWPVSSRRERTLLLVLMLIVLAAAAHDLLVFLQWVPGTRYYAGIASCALLVALAVLLARRFTQALRETEQFNARLIAQVEAAKTELRDTLERTHALKLMHARAHERVALASDLHDGLGGMLVGSIASLEHASQPVPQDRILAMLKDLRDDLRLILDATGQQPGLQPLDDVIAPLRHRLGTLFEANGIVCRWHLLNVGDLTLTTSLNIGVLRFLQEALTNVLKHSGARRADVYVTRTRTHLRLDVRDDGRGFAVESAGDAPGNGLRNMRTRAERLAGVVQWQSRPGRTVVTLLIDLLSAR